MCCVKWSSHWLFEQISLETVTTQESHTPTATLSFAVTIMEPICSADFWSRLNTVSSCVNRIFRTWSRAEHQAHVLFVYLAQTKGFVWNVNFLFSSQPALGLSVALLGNTVSFLRVCSQCSHGRLNCPFIQMNEALFFFPLENQTQTSPCESFKNVENQGLSEVTSTVFHVCVCLFSLPMYGNLYPDMIIFCLTNFTPWSSFTSASFFISATSVGFSNVLWASINSCLFFP